MKSLIGVDVGSTFTDVVFVSRNNLEYVKVETTPHDLTVCFMDGIKKCVGKNGEVGKTLSQSEPVRWASTVATNIIAMKTGTPVGFIVTKGMREVIAKEAISEFIPDDLLVEIDEAVDASGYVGKEIDKSELIDLVETLLDRGARSLAISFRSSHENPANERAAKKILNEEYPEYYLGSTDTILASDITPRPDYVKRSMSTLLDAYVHNGLVKFLYKGEEELYRCGARYPMFIVHATGGMARAAKTVGLHTIGAGPTASLSYTALLGNLYNEEPIITFEVGGTTTNCSIGTKNGGFYSADVAIENLPLYLYSPDVTSIAMGGGTIITLDGDKLEVGPKSAGAVPGPACFDLGNDDPTLCDVNLVLGFLDPEYFEGGARRLVKELAVEALEPLSRNLHVSVEGVGRMSLDIARQKQAELVREKSARYGIVPEHSTMVVCGGEGPLHACFVADRLGIKKVIIPQNSAIFGAVGCVLMNVASMYESYQPTILRDGSGVYSSDLAALNGTVEMLRHSVILDMKAQGFRSDDITYCVELEVRDGAKSFALNAQLPPGKIFEAETVKAICERFADEYRQANGLGQAALPGEISTDIIRLKGILESTPAWQPVTYSPANTSVAAALKGVRDVFWGEIPTRTSIYQGEKLECGQTVQGPVIIEEQSTTIAIPDGWKCSVDKYLNKVVEKA